MKNEDFANAVRTAGKIVVFRNRISPDSGSASFRRVRIPFTLIELLIVISIISLLAAMLLPALRSGMNLAKATHCKSNMRSFGLRMAVYADDFDQYYMPYNVAMYSWGGGYPNTDWFCALSGTTRKRPATIYPGQGKLFKELVTCKAMNTPPGQTYNTQHFAYNVENNNIYGTGVYRYAWVRLTQIPRPARAVTMSESNGNSVWHEQYFGTDKYDVTRHGSGGVTLFWDGHCVQLAMKFHRSNRNLTTWNRVVKPDGTVIRSGQ